MKNSWNTKWRMASVLILGFGACGELPSDSLLGSGMPTAAAQSWPSILKKDKSDPTKKPTDIHKSSNATAAPLNQIRLQFTAQNWDAVLKKVSADLGTTLVMDQIPKGRFTRTDLGRHSKTEALRILNQELEQQDFRIVDKGIFLIVLYLPDARPEYRRAQVEEAAVTPSTKTPQAGATAESKNRRPGVIQASDARPAIGPANGPQRESGLRTANFQSDDEPRVDSAQSAVRIFKPKVKSARQLSSTLFDAFRERAEVIEEGPGGVRGLRIFATEAAGKDGERPVLFTLGLDADNDQILVQGSTEQADRIVRLLQRLDTKTQENDEATKLVSTKKGATAVAKNVHAAIGRLVSQNDARPDDAKNGVKTETNRKDEDGKDLPDTVAGVRSDVNVEAMEELGILILKGNQADVDAVMAIIRQIEELSATTAPDVHLRVLKNVDAVALAELLTSVYDKLKDAQGKKTEQGGGVSIIGVVRPNAILVLAAARDLDSVLELIEQLDKPIPAQSGFAVFPLQHAIASQVETMLLDFYDKTGNLTERGGLGTRIRIVADVRTNQVVVLAKPNDLKEITKLIEKLDRSESGSVSQVQIYPLKHAVADDLAQTLNLIFQSVLNPAQLGQGQLGQQALGIGGGNSSQQLKEVRSTILEYLGGAGADQQRYRSGILADIRINGDNRSNNLIVTAPKESVDLISSLVDRLDRPASNTAEIKYFNLRNADATSVVSLLNQLFNGQQQQGGGGGQGQNNQNNQQPGIQLAAAQDAPSVVPLRFSADVRTNSVVAIGTIEALGVVEALMARMDEGEVRERKMKVFRLKNTEALGVATSIQAFMTAQVTLLQQQTGGGGGGQQGNGGGLVSAFELIEKQILVQAEPQTNSVLISASPRYFDEIVKMVESLDEDLPQVIIQALLVEVTLDNTDEFGVELGFQDPILFRRGAVANGMLSPGFQFNSSNIGNATAANPSSVGTQGLSNLNVGRINNDLGFGGLVLSAGSDSVSVLLRALAHRRKLEVLSRPQIRTLHNQLGSIQVAKQVPLVNGFTQTSLGATTPNITYANAGITLNVIPKVGPDGTIQLRVKAEKTTLDTQGVTIQGATATTGAVSSPIIDGTTAEATLTVADQETVVLGGLITKNTDTLQRKIPWLGDLPVLGAAFRYDKTVQKRTELLIFLTPRVVRNTIENEEIKNIETARLHWTECDAEEIHGPIFGLPPNWSAAPEMSPPLVDPSQFDGVTPREPKVTTPPPVPAEGTPMSQRFKDSGVRQVSHQEPARTAAKPGTTSRPRPMK